MRRNLQGRGAGRARSVLKALFPLIGFVFVLIIFLIGTQGQLFSRNNLENLVDQGFTTIVVSVGASLIYACGMMDVSLGSVMAFSMLIIGRLLNAGGWPVALVMLIGILCAMAWTSVTAVITHCLKVQPMIASLCVMNITAGIVKTAIATSELYISYKKYAYFNSIPLKAAVLLLVILLGLIIFNRTRLGREVKAIGGNRAAAVQSGICIGRSVWLGFICCGFCIGIAAMFSLCYTGILNSQTGTGVGLNVIVALVLGGYPISGGSRARMLSAIMGALTVTVLVNGLSLMGIDAAAASVVKGVLLLIIVGLSYERVKGAEVV